MGLPKVQAVGSQDTKLYTWDEMGRSRIVQILVSYDPNQLKCLQFTYLLDNGKLHTSDIIGSTVFMGSMFHVITFKGGSEFVAKVEGLYTNTIPYCYFTKLSIHTNLQVYKVFEAENMSGATSYKKFRFDFGGLNQFGGFYGTHSGYGIRSIGVYYNNLQTLPPNFKCKSAPKHEVED